jgi:dienelactone hydrolase
LQTIIPRPAVIGPVFWCIASLVALDASAASLERVEFGSTSQPLIPGDRIQGLLAKPDGAGPFPAVVGLHGCAGMQDTTKSKLADDLVASGYVTLLVDSFATRGIDHACTYNAALAVASRRISDAYGALAFLAHQPFVDIRRVAAVGFSQGGWVTLSVAETRSFVVPSELRFRAAVTFYPLCSAAGSRPEIPTLILVGALDDWTPSEDCARKVVSWGTEGPPIELVVYPGTYHGFYNPHFQPRSTLFGHWVEYNGEAADDASVRIRQFLNHHLN